MPEKEADVSHLFAMMVQSGNYDDQIRPVKKLGRYIDDSTDLICEDSAGEPLLVEIEMSLPNLFRHGHPMTSYDVVVVWERGGIKVRESRMAPWGAGGGTVSVTLKSAGSGGWVLTWGTHEKPLLVLSEILP
jgi:hypothetical protein